MENFFKKKPKSTASIIFNAEACDENEIATENFDSSIDSAANSSISHEEASSSSSSEPKDISSKGEAKKSQDFSKHVFKKQSDGRSFQNNWLTKFEWLEYSKEKDAAFCYACRQFGTGIMKDIFTTNGYTNWQAALSTGKGFKKHETTAVHLKSMLDWKEKVLRSSKNQQVSNLLNETVLEKRRYYFKAIVESVLFLVKNELSFIPWFF